MAARHFTLRAARHFSNERLANFASGLIIAGLIGILFTLHLARVIGFIHGKIAEALLVRAAREVGLAANFYTFYGNGLGAPAAIGEAGVSFSASLMCLSASEALAP